MQQKKLSLFIAAGSGKSTKKIKVNGKEVDKAYLELEGKTSLEHVISAALNAEHIRDIYIWGDLRKLSKIQKKYSTKKDIVIVPQKRALVDSIYETFMSYYLPLQAQLPQFEGYVQVWSDVKKYIQQNGGCIEEAICISASDIPLVKSEDYDNMINDFFNRNIDFLIGAGKKQEMVDAMHSVGIDFDNSALKKLYKCYALGKDEYRLNNIFIFKPLKLSLNIIRLIQQVYNHRYMYKFFNVVDIGFKMMFGAVKETIQHPSMLYYIPDILLKYVMINLAKTPWVKKYFPTVYEFSKNRSDISAIEKTASSVLRGKLSIFTNGSYRTIMDIDEQESYDFFRKEGYFAKLKGLK